jgi:hypothetical protein
MDILEIERGLLQYFAVSPPLYKRKMLHFTRRFNLDSVDESGRRRLSALPVRLSVEVFLLGISKRYEYESLRIQ